MSLSVQTDPQVCYNMSVSENNENKDFLLSLQVTSCTTKELHQTFRCLCHIQQLNHWHHYISHKVTDDF